MSNEVNNKNNKKNKAKIALITGTIVCSTVLTACGPRFIYNGYQISNNRSITTETSNIQNSTDSQDNSNSYSDNTHGLSYNAFLYSSKRRLSDSVSANDYGLDSSKNTDNADRRLQNDPYQNTSIDLTQEHLGDFVKVVNNENITYKYADLYDIDNALEAVNSYNSEIDNQVNLYNDLICNIDEIPSPSLLVDKINNNNRVYLAANSNFDSISNEYVNIVANAIVDYLNNYHDSLDEVTLKKVYSMINDVKVVGIDSSDFTKNSIRKVYNAAALDDGTIALDLKEIKKITQDKGVEKTIYHEVAHLFQRQAPDAKIDGLTQIGGSQYVESFDNTGEVNSLHYLWLYEASAELMSMDLNESKKPLVYKNMVGYLNTLDLITLIRPGYEEDSIAISQMSNDPNKIFEVMGATTNEEKVEIMYMLYSICYISDNREDFTGAYENQYGKGSLTNDTDKVKNEMRASMAKTMTKYFYRNLAERVANADVTMEDAFYLINVFESSLSRHLWYDDSSLYSMFEDTIRYYVETQDMFFQYIAQDSGYSYDDVVDRFNNFAMVYIDNGRYFRNNSFTWLDDKEKTYVGDVFTNNIKDFTVNIRNIALEHNMKLK